MNLVLVGWHDAILRMNYADTGSMQGPMIYKRRDMTFSRYPKASDVINYVRHGYSKPRYTILHGSKPSQVWTWPEEKCFDCWIMWSTFVNVFILITIYCNNCNKSEVTETQMQSWIHNVILNIIKIIPYNFFGVISIYYHYVSIRLSILFTFPYSILFSILFPTFFCLVKIKLSVFGINHFSCSV